MVTMVTEKLLIHLAQQTMEEKEAAVQHRVKTRSELDIWSISWRFKKKN